MEKPTSQQIEKRTRKVQEEIVNLKEKLEKLREDKERRLLNSESVTNINTRIAEAQSGICDRELLLEALKRKQSELLEREKQEEREKRIETLQKRAKSVKAEAHKCITELFSHYSEIKNAVHKLQEIDMTLRDVQNEIHSLGISPSRVGLVTLIPAPSAVRLLVDNPNIANFLKQVKKQLED